MSNIEVKTSLFVIRYSVFNIKLRLLLITGPV
jgi:hypothetical protein